MTGDGKPVFRLHPTDEPYVKALKFVSKEQYDALTLSENGEWLSYQKYATALAIPIGTFKSRLNRARLKIIRWRNSSTAP